LPSAAWSVRADHAPLNDAGERPGAGVHSDRFGARAARALIGVLIMLLVLATARILLGRVSPPETFRDCVTLTSQGLVDQLMATSRWEVAAQRDGRNGAIETTLCFRTRGVR
jgi:hypothetical protein